MDVLEAKTAQKPNVRSTNEQNLKKKKNIAIDYFHIVVFEKCCGFDKMKLCCIFNGFSSSAVVVAGLFFIHAVTMY